FTNVYRAADRVSQYLIRNVIYEGEQSCEEVFFRTLLFKLFNKIETWEELTAHLDRPTWKLFDVERYAGILDRMIEQGSSINSAGYIMPSPPFGSPRKHRNHLSLLRHMIDDGAPERISQARTLRNVFEILRSYPSLGDFLSLQFTIDLNYSAIIDFS